ncbi:MAG: hypothetical protein M1436_00035 [Acidobacteria bacterium]|nr:hypothetical protein [Acidobacteriota bacterium]
MSRGLAILLLLAATIAAPALDEVVGFFSDAPYVEYCGKLFRGGVDGAAEFPFQAIH